MEAPKKSPREELLALVPETAVRLKVRDDRGAERWRDIAENRDSVLDTDEILTKNGVPIAMFGTPGRRGKGLPEHAPSLSSAPSTAALASAQVARARHLENDPLINALSEGMESEEILGHILRGFATEAACLEFERLEAERHGKETTKLSFRRINALRALGDTWLKRKEQLSSRSIDMESPAFERLFAFMLETFRTSMLMGGVARDVSENVFVHLSQRVSDEAWNEEAKLRMRGA